MHLVNISLPLTPSIRHRLSRTSNRDRITEDPHPARSLTARALTHLAPSSLPAHSQLSFFSSQDCQPVRADPRVGEGDRRTGELSRVRTRTRTKSSSPQTAPNSTADFPPASSVRVPPHHPSQHRVSCSQLQKDNIHIHRSSICTSLLQLSKQVARLSPVQLSPDASRGGCAACPSGPRGSPHASFSGVVEDVPYL
jgi:hypothetical protein